MRRLALQLPILLAAGLAAAAAPAAAAKGDARCASAPGEIRAAAASADPQAARAALRHLGVGEQLCAAGNPREAAKKFKAAAKELGLGDAGTQVAAAGNR